MESVLELGLPWAIDNGAFSNFDAEKFIALIERCAGKPGLLWCAAPDVVGDAAATLKRFDEWEPILSDLGIPMAFVGQDGQEDLLLPWDRFSCLFIGGSTGWKLSDAAHGLMIEAKQRGKLVHMGRVNSKKRITLAYQSGADSFDGTSMSMFGDAHIGKFCNHSEQLKTNGFLFRPQEPTP